MKTWPISCVVWDIAATACLRTDANAKLEQWDNAAAAPLAEGEQDGAVESKGEAVGVKDDADFNPR